MDAVLQALGTPRRRAILRLVWSAERSAGEIHRSFRDVTFGAVSQHLSVLLEAGLVDVRRAGRERFYRARKRDLGPLAAWLESMWSTALDRLAEQAELESARRGPRAVPPRGRRRGRPRKRQQKSQPRSPR
jgi:DNA-binding transcriptional ArsR family regulator